MKEETASSSASFTSALLSLFMTAMTTEARNSAFHAALNLLSPELRQVVVLRDLEERSYSDIASILNLPVSTVRTRLNLARSTLARSLKTAVRETQPPKAGAPVVGRAGDISNIVPTIAHAVAVFGDEHKASHWLATPLPLFDNHSPSQVLDREGGVELVEQILTRIEHNIPS
jgi:putative toxin-antitoxin system antitoxin component (TIGR02293 family)